MFINKRSEQLYMKTKFRPKETGHFIKLFVESFELHNKLR